MLRCYFAGLFASNYLPSMIGGDVLRAALAMAVVPQGKEIVVEGKLSSREYEDNSGNKRTVVELTADRVHFCGSKDSAPQKPAQTFEEISEDDGDFPF